MGRWKIRVGTPGLDVWRGKVGRQVHWAGGMPRRAWRNPHAWAVVVLLILGGISLYEWTRPASPPPTGDLNEIWRDAGQEVAPETDAMASTVENGDFASDVQPEPRPRAAEAVPAVRPTEAGPAGAKIRVEAAMPIRTLAWPLRGDRGAGFGWTYSATMGDWRWHRGLDLAAPPGEPVSAAATGRIVVARQTREWGWELVVDHGGGLSTRYANCQAVAVAAGDVVRAGQKLAEVGAPGLAEAADKPHLHFEVLANGRPVDPLGYVEK